MLRNIDDAKDAAQEVFLKVLKKEGSGMDLNEIENVEAWLCRIAANECLTRIRQKKRKQADRFPFGEDEIPAQGNIFDRLDLKMAFDAIMENEPDLVSICCYLYFFQGMKQTDIIPIVGREKSWVSETIKAFKKKFRENVK